MRQLHRSFAAAFALSAATVFLSGCRGGDPARNAGDSVAKGGGQMRMMGTPPDVDEVMSTEYTARTASQSGARAQQAGPTPAVFGPKRRTYSIEMTVPINTKWSELETALANNQPADAQQIVIDNILSANRTPGVLALLDAAFGANHGQKPDFDVTLMEDRARPSSTTPVRLIRIVMTVPIKAADWANLQSYVADPAQYKDRTYCTVLNNIIPPTDRTPKAKRALEAPNGANPTC